MLTAKLRYRKLKGAGAEPERAPPPGPCPEPGAARPGTPQAFASVAIKNTHKIPKATNSRFAFDKGDLLGSYFCFVCSSFTVHAD